MNDLLAQAQYIPRALLLTAVLLPACLYIRDHMGSLRASLLPVLKRGWVVLFFLYLSAMLISTIFARPVTNPFQGVLGHFWFWKGYIRWNNEIIENTLFFIPYTFLFLQAAAPKRPVRAAFLLSAATSAAIELIQLVFWLGLFQLSDILYNTLGGMLGCGLWFVLKWTKRWIKSRIIVKNREE